MPRTEFQERSGRETRLLILVIVVSVALLLLLARFRFPAANLTAVTPPAGPLAGLAARASFEDMASTLSTVLTRIAPLVTIVDLAPEEPPALPARGTSRSSARARGAAGASAETPEPKPHRLAAAVHLQPDMALVYTPKGWLPASPATAPGSVNVVAFDAVREIALIRTAPVNELATNIPSGSYVGFGYVAAVDVTASGPTVQPVFVGRADAMSDPRWSRPLLDIGRAIPIESGTWVFAMDGRLLGLAAAHNNDVAIVPADALIDAVQELRQRGPSQ